MPDSKTKPAVKNHLQCFWSSVRRWRLSQMKKTSQELLHCRVKAPLRGFKGVLNPTGGMTRKALQQFTLRDDVQHVDETKCSQYCILMVLVHWNSENIWIEWVQTFYGTCSAVVNNSGTQRWNCRNKARESINRHVTSSHTKWTVLKGRRARLEANHTDVSHSVLFCWHSVSVRGNECFEHNQSEGFARD